MIKTALWTSDETTNAEIGLSTAPWLASGVSIDSRTVAPGDLFIALVGPNFDGHDYVGDAFRKGAAAAMVSRRDPKWDGPLLLVDDTFEGLHRLGAAGRNRNGGRIIAVTGSVGKTGTKTALEVVLAAQAQTHASAGSFNNHWGAPLSLARMPQDARYGVFELGMNHAGEIGPLSRLVRPQVAIITNVEPVHLEAFDSVSGIARAKAEIFEGLEPGGIAILNRDNDHYELLADAARAREAEIRSFGSHRESDARLIKVVVKEHCTCVAAEIMGDPVTFKIGAAGHHWALNSLAVLLATVAAGADLGRAALALQDVHEPKGRGERHEVELRDGVFTVIDESYNASPVAVRAALKVLAGLEPDRRGRRLVVLGDMLELGERSAELHQALGKDVIAADADQVFACGPMMKELFDSLPTNLKGAWAENSRDLLPSVREAVLPGDVVMVKGSLGSRMGLVVEELLKLDRGSLAANGN